MTNLQKLQKTLKIPETPKESTLHIAVQHLLGILWISFLVLSFTSLYALFRPEGFGAIIVSEVSLGNLTIWNWIENIVSITILMSLLTWGYIKFSNLIEISLFGIFGIYKNTFQKENKIP